MEFDFLPKLPNSNLDDRTFDELVEECVLRIPRYCPEWTDHNLSDPGVTLIELFAWLTDQMLLRFNQVPRKNYVAFLELLGIRLQPPAPARTDITFYLTTYFSETYIIPTGLQVATLGTEMIKAVVFSTDSPLLIGKPSLRHFLTSQTSEDSPLILRDRVSNQWTRQPDGTWFGNEQLLFEENPQPGNCFYLVMEPDEPIEGNVLSITFQGSAASPTGINPNQAPRRWEAWDGKKWQPVLLQEADDATRGFSFHEITELDDNAAQIADLILHLPLSWPVASFTTYRGRWIRCVFTEPEGNQPSYNSSPRIISLAVQSIGGTVRASHSTLIENERLGISDGTPGQTYELEASSILERREDEYILVTPPGGLPQTWLEVTDFADSGPDDRHYTIDSLTGTVQFGPLIREPDQLQRKTKIRSKIQQPQPYELRTQQNDPEMRAFEHQYGAIPPRGSTIVIVAYRTGGGRQGNVQSGTLQFLRSAFPYVARAINHKPATNGADGESLEQAVLRAPRILRTRDRAVTAEDFEVLAQRAGAGAVARVHCLPATASADAGIVRLVIVPQANTDAIAHRVGIAPEAFVLQPSLQEQILAYLDDRRLLGVQVLLQEPNYVGVSVQTEIALEPTYNNSLAQREIALNLQIALYQFLNPLTGGLDGKGWPFGRPVYTSDIIALLQQTPGVRYIGPVLMFPIRKNGDTWVRQNFPEQVIDPGLLGLVCSWADSGLRSSHSINFITR